MKSSIDGWALTVCTPAWVWARDVKVLGLVCGHGKAGKERPPLGIGTQARKQDKAKSHNGARQPTRA
ncbi:hypothetical protein MCOR27_004837 [Pyricularia oryzae]|uniref:Uncharacterized protein n=1 Tax=Pyricularia oryzae (strain 70-15 / ATCC MYA-4617 / FGSC 8958) TaxID=242507 RepID=G4MQ88_PYRO7|nr:uncharacterized protein MGG_16262 [Pyricularia oryzae 70-15]KAI6280159.1 hypothetical protein MCOR27_004837 [Pyricularia oryzae]EHA57281.1 hypothetical protein MGG_16262 [Pyricularia oryzae 70-15]KAI6283577.1 hypothetical protein MCOR26_002398 [Pyricularia oryzae]KAI6420327.1 hypothetical protein MCOR21_009793 [Pyricularia oryzae]KAI6443994.1 hypothetical protein MCOR22_005086 [Pyricularia oryzae]